MSEKKKVNPGGCLVQVILGGLALVAAVLAVLFFLSSGPRDAVEGPSVADDAAAGAQQVEPVAPAPTAPAAKPAAVSHPADVGIDPASDDQIAEDAAAAGMTSRPPSPEGE